MSMQKETQTIAIIDFKNAGKEMTMIVTSSGDATGVYFWGRLRCWATTTVGRIRGGMTL